MNGHDLAEQAAQMSMWSQLVDWPLEAERIILLVARSGEEFTSEDVRSIAPIHCEPSEDRAWGAIFLKLAKRGVIRKVGYQTSHNPWAHARPVSVWRLV